MIENTLYTHKCFASKFHFVSFNLILFFPHCHFQFISLFM